VARGETVPGELRERHIESSFGAAAADYELRPWRGHVVLMRAEELAFAFRGLGAAYGWDELVGERFEMIQVPGNHDTLVLEPNASTLVRALRDVLDATQDAVLPAAADRGDGLQRLPAAGD
jgi:thioesterase domain-containing protein